jgi:hypothetical protein
MDLLVQGAYGRKYTHSDQVRKDWDEGKDFQVVLGPYCSKRDDFAELGYTRVIFALYINGNQPILWKADAR